ncbi:DUF2889 family protein [Actinocorallia herbida]|uniref:DUF2889 family protein n=1 Tax=Actinocorallia herbida TaxID=58109 RepID=A0A3N1CX34_9ACTN|nr:DUF2889 domain-containing protein [Actinocorallia herbida]ROO85278.1 DUF2889 family protein [Actinocorallia herbida]
MSAPTVLGPLGPAPARVAGSVRRTSTLDTTWPGGFDGPMLTRGRARDLRTFEEEGPKVVAEDALTVRFAPGSRTITAIAADPARAGLAGLVGGRAGGGLRALVGQALPAERTARTPLHLLLDDLGGASLVAPMARSRWLPDPSSGLVTDPLPMTGVCTGFQPGSSALTPEAPALQLANQRPVAALSAHADPWAWHALPDHEVPAARRARRLDVTRTADAVMIDAMFQDSTTIPEGGRVAVHEYRVRATADPSTLVLRTLSAEPRILPYTECPLAVGTLPRLLGLPLADLAGTVHRALPGVAGCTHLNDALRGLSDVPALLVHL